MSADNTFKGTPGEREGAGLVAAAPLSSPQDAFEVWYCAEAAKEGLIFTPADITRHRKGNGYRSDYGALNGKWEVWLALTPRIATAYYDGFVDGVMRDPWETAADWAALQGHEYAKTGARPKFIPIKAAEPTIDQALIDLEWAYPGCFWVLGYGKTRAAEPPFGIRVLFGTDEVLAEGEGATAIDAILAAIGETTLSEEATGHAITQAKALGGDA